MTNWISDPAEIASPRERSENGDRNSHSIGWIEGESGLLGQ